MKLKSRRTVGERWICGCRPNMVIRRDTLGMSVWLMQASELRDPTTYTESTYRGCLLCLQMTNDSIISVKSTLQIH